MRVPVSIYMSSMDGMSYYKRYTASSQNETPNSVSYAIILIFIPIQFIKMAPTISNNDTFTNSAIRLDALITAFKIWGNL